MLQSWVPMPQPGCLRLRADMCNAKGGQQCWCAPVLQSVSGGGV